MTSKSENALEETTWDSYINICPGSTPTVNILGISQETVAIQEEALVEEHADLEKDFQCETNSSISWGSEISWPDFELPGTWGVQGIEQKPWNDIKRPCVQFRKYDEIELNKVEHRGVLTDRLIAACSSYLDKSPETEKFVFCKLVLSKKLLTDIKIISYHHYLQYIDLSWNELSEVEALGQLPFLMYLDVSNNFLEQVLDFKAPFYLTYVNYSFNHIKHIDDLHEFWSITHLDLSHNYIKVIEGLNQLQYLRHLNLSFNMIEYIENLNYMKLLSLNLQNNCITKFEEGENVGFKTSIEILHINLSFNYLRTLKLFEGICGIQSINMSSNLIDDLMEVSHLRNLNFLTELDLSDNPITGMKYYMDVCLNNVKHLYTFDGELLEAERKVAAKASFEPTPQLESMKNYSKILFLQQLNDPLLGLPTLPMDESSPPIIILVGPLGVGKAKLLQTFCHLFNSSTIMGISHTTRDRTDEEVQNESYYFITKQQFWDMAKKGEFLTVSQVFGQHYGLAENEIAKTVNKSEVLILKMDLAGALTLRAKGFRCNLILTLTSTVETHRTKFLEKYNRHEDSNYFGASEIQYDPIEAQKFVEGSDKLSKPKFKGNAQKVTLTPVNSRNVSRSESIDEDQAYDYTKVNSSNSHTFGILKTPAGSKTKNDLPQTRTSVTFQSSTTVGNTILTANQRAVSYRSVTFSERPQLNEPSNKQQFSVSSTAVSDSEHGLFSVLSHPLVSNKDDVIAQTSTKLWSLKTDSVKDIADEVVKSRDLYLGIHYENPGLFSDLVFTDASEEALEKLQQILKACIKSQGKQPSIFEYQKDSVYHTMVATRLKNLHNEINMEMSTSQKQLAESMLHATTEVPLQSQIKDPKRSSRKDAQIKASSF